jgi:hypothetical protein
MYEPVPLESFASIFVLLNLGGPLTLLTRRGFYQRAVHAGVLIAQQNPPSAPAPVPATTSLLSRLPVDDQGSWRIHLPPTLAHPCSVP